LFSAKKKQANYKTKNVLKWFFLTFISYHHSKYVRQKTLFFTDDVFVSFTKEGGFRFEFFLWRLNSSKVSQSVWHQCIEIGFACSTCLWEIGSHLFKGKVKCQENEICLVSCFPCFKLQRHSIAPSVTESNNFERKFCYFK